MAEEIKHVGEKTQLIFECAVCKKLYKQPGMCAECQLILKPKGG